MENNDKNKKITIKDVAKEAGVSVSTVSRVLRNYDNVPEETHELVHAAVKKLNYIPNIAASNLGAGSLKNIGVVVTRSAEYAFKNPFFSEMIMGIGSVLEKHDYNVQLIMTNDIRKERTKVMNALASGMIQGVILLYSRKYDMLIQDLANSNYPFVVSGRVEGISSFKNEVHSVDTDNFTGSYKLVSHLIELGHKRIAFLNGSMDYIVNIDRYEGYRQALIEGGITHDHTLDIECGNTFDESKNAVKNALAKDSSITAIFCRDDYRAFATIQAINEMGLSVPDDIAVVGYNNYDIASISTPKLTTLNVPIYQLGKSAGKQIINLIQGNPVESFPEILDTELIVRESSGKHI